MIAPVKDKYSSIISNFRIVMLNRENEWWSVECCAEVGQEKQEWHDLLRI